MTGFTSMVFLVAAAETALRVDLVTGRTAAVLQDIIGGVRLYLQNARYLALSITVM